MRTFIVSQKAEGGIYKEIGDGLRHRPNSLLNDSSSGPDLVREGNSVYITVGPNDRGIISKLGYGINYVFNYFRVNHLQSL